MRKINLILANAAIAAALLLSSCKKDEDETEAGEAAAPSVVLQNNSASTAITGNTSVEKGSTILFNVQVFKGDKNAKTLEVKKNGVSINASSTPLTVNNKTENNNPFNVDNDKFYEFEFTASSTEGAKDSYEFIVKDADDLTSSVTVEVSTNVSSPSLTSNTGHTIYNKNGNGKGAFDFDALVSVSSTDASGDIQDQGISGIDAAARVNLKELVIAADSWKKQFVAENSASLKSITKAQYEGATTLSDIEGLFSPASEEPAVAPSAMTYSVDNAYVVKTSAGKYVAFIITAVTEHSVNEDFATFSSKSVVSNKVIRDNALQAN